MPEDGNRTGVTPFFRSTAESAFSAANPTVLMEGTWAAKKANGSEKKPDDQQQRVRKTKLNGNVLKAAALNDA